MDFIGYMGQGMYNFALGAGVFKLFDNDFVNLDWAKIGALIVTGFVIDIVANYAKDKKIEEIADATGKKDLVDFKNRLKSAEKEYELNKFQNPR